MFVAHSRTPRTPSVCALQDEMGRSVRVEVTTTLPEVSPEYSRSLSAEIETAVTCAAWARRTCDGDGACMRMLSSSLSSVTLALRTGVDHRESGSGSAPEMEGASGSHRHVEDYNRHHENPLESPRR